MMTTLDHLSEDFITWVVEDCFGLRTAPCWLRRVAIVLFPITLPLMFIGFFLAILVFLLMQLLIAVARAWECNHESRD